MAEHPGEYVAIARGDIVGTYSSFDEAARAVEQEQAKLVFQIGDEPVLAPLYVSWGKRSHPDDLSQYTADTNKGNRLRALQGRKLGRIER